MLISSFETNFLIFLSSLKRQDELAGDGNVRKSGWMVVMDTLWQRKMTMEFNDGV
jgi:hypothetical protein